MRNQHETVFHLQNYMKGEYGVINWTFFLSKEMSPILLDMLFSVTPITISFNKIKFITGDGLLWLMYISLFRKINDYQTSFVLPNNRNLLFKLRILGFNKLKREVGFIIFNEFLSPTGVKYDKAFELQYINRNNYPRLEKRSLDNVRNYLVERYQIQSNEVLYYKLLPFLRTIEEVSSNIVFHGGRNVEGYSGEGLVSLLSTQIIKKYITYSFCDIGKGFLNSFKIKHDRKDLVSEHDAILEALLYRHNYQETGIIGLFGTLGFIADRMGSISIRSRDQLLSIDFSDNKTLEIYLDGLKSPSKQLLESLSITRTGLCDIPGVHIRIKLLLP